MPRETAVGRLRQGSHLVYEVKVPPSLDWKPATRRVIQSFVLTPPPPGTRVPKAGGDLTVHQVQDEAQLVRGVEGVRHAHNEGAVLRERKVASIKLAATQEKQLDSCS